MTSEYRLPKISIDLGDFPEAERFGVWHDLMSGVFDIKPLNPDSSTYYARGEAYDIGSTVLSSWWHSPSFINSDRNSSAIQREELLVLSISQQGGAFGTMNDVSFEMKQSNLVVYDIEAQIASQAKACLVQEFVFPYSEVGYDPSKHSSFLDLGRDTPASRIIGLNFDSLQELIPHCTVHEAKQLSDAFCGLLKGLISQNYRDEAARFHFFRAREAAVRRFVRLELKNPDLNAETVCREIGLSRANLFRMFKEEGGFGKALLKLRLEGALLELSRTPPSHGAIVRVARNWTFFDQAHFSRLFKAEFGVRPSDAVGTAVSSSNHDSYVSSRSQPGDGSSDTRLADLYSSGLIRSGQKAG